MQHIFTGQTAPSTPPQGVGHHYVDTLAKKTYLSIGITSVSDWFEVSTPVPQPQWAKTTHTLSPADISNGYINLAHVVIPNSLSLSQSRVNFYESVEYQLSTVGGVTRITFIGPAVSGLEAFAAGEILYIQYSYLV